MQIDSWTLEHLHEADRDDGCSVWEQTSSEMSDESQGSQ